ncbi:glycosyltransferase family 2 protein [Candidatus Saccharibacteria bacterium]|nr:glycosyltransferase family 2 protein [Candidatus Saccharibacteria bacterium]
MKHPAKHPALSIIVPVFNAETTIKPLVERILSQAFTDFELILINDGSTDATAKILKTLKDPRIKIITQKNRGASGARNTGLSHARGRFIMLVDCDDDFAPNFFTSMVAKIEATKSDLVTCGIRFQDLRHHTTTDIGITKLPPQPKTPTKAHPTSAPGSSNFRTWIVQLLGIDGRLYNPCNKIFRTEIIKKHRLHYDESLDFGEDLTFNLHYLAHCQKIDFILEPLYIYNFDPRTGLFGTSSLVYSNRQKNFQSLVEFAEGKSSEARPSGSASPTERRENRRLSRDGLCWIKIKWFYSYLLALSSTDKLTLPQKLHAIKTARKSETFPPITKTPTSKNPTLSQKQRFFARAFALLTRSAALSLLAAKLYSTRKTLKSFTLHQILFLGLPVALFFTYHPRLDLGPATTFHFRTSLAVLYFALFSLLHLPRLIRFHPPLPLFLFLSYIWLSLLWSANPARGLLTASLITLVVTTIISASFYRSLLPKFRQIFIATAVLFSLYGLLQFTLAIFHTNLTMCAGCLPSILGYPRTTALFIEPQFFGGILVLAFLLARRFPTQLLLAVGVILTMSRGAIYSLVLATFVLILAHFFTKTPLRQNLRFAIRYLTLGLISLALGLLALGFSTHHYPGLTFQDGPSRAIEQLSLGHISITSNQVDFSQDINMAKIPATHEEQQTTEPRNDGREGSVSEHVGVSEKSTLFDGYIDESTSIRLDLSRAGLKAWQKTPATIIFGTGIGSAGIAMSQVSDFTPLEIVQNQYIETLLELGLLGSLLTLILIFTLLFSPPPSTLSQHRPSPSQPRPPLPHKPRPNHRLSPENLALLTAASVQILFFSGLPNALYLYLILPLFLISTPVKPENNHE